MPIPKFNCGRSEYGCMAWMMLIFHDSISAAHQYPSNNSFKSYICTMLCYDMTFTNRGMNDAQVEYSSDNSDEYRKQCLTVSHLASTD